MGTIGFQEGKGDRLLVAEGRLNIQDASALKEHLAEAFHAGDTLILDLRGVDSMDLACVQVLCSANNTFRDAQKTIRINGPLPDGVLRSLEDMSVGRQGCGLEKGDRCLWITGGGDE